MKRALLPILVAVAASCRPAAERPNVFLITLDTLRADRLGCYGSSSTRTPHLDALAAEGLLFENAVSPLPETRPAHFTIFTGRYPREHGVVSNSLGIDPSMPLLSERFLDAGYRTAGFAGCGLFGVDSGAQRGFDRFSMGGEHQRPAREVVAELLTWLEGVDRGVPVFAWAHLFDPHTPYAPPPASHRSRPDAPFEELTWPLLLATARAHGGDLPGSFLERGKELYDGEVEATDDAIGALLEGLERRGRGALESIVLVVADHGECFENGVFFEHAWCLFDGAVRVPLLLRAPGRVPEGRRVASTVELTAIAPTLLRLAGLPMPPEAVGRDLLSMADHPPRRSFAFLQLPGYNERQVENRAKVLAPLRTVGGVRLRPLYGDRLQVGLRSADWKYLRVGEAEELYRLSTDPTESTDVAGEHPEVLSSMRGLVNDWLRSYPPRSARPAAVNSELERTMVALGYL